MARANVSGWKPLGARNHEDCHEEEEWKEGGPVVKPWFRRPLSEESARQKSAIRAKLKGVAFVKHYERNPSELDRQGRGARRIGEAETTPLVMPRKPVGARVISSAAWRCRLFLAGGFQRLTPSCRSSAARRRPRRGSLHSLRSFRSPTLRPPAYPRLRLGFALFGGRNVSNWETLGARNHEDCHEKEGKRQFLHVPAELAWRAGVAELGQASWLTIGIEASEMRASSAVS